MKILHIQHPYVPGLGYQENFLPAWQKKIGHQVKLITSDILPKKFSGLNHSFSPGSELHNGVSICRLPTLIYFESTDHVILKKLRENIRQYGPDVIHIHGLVNPLLIQTLFTIRGLDAGVFVDIHVDNDNYHSDTPTKKLLETGFRRLLFPKVNKHVDAFLPVQLSAKQFLKQNFSVPDSKIRLLPLGVDATKFYPDSGERKRTRNELGVQANEFLIIFSGNITESKDIGVLLDSLCDIVIDAPVPVNLLILGKGPDEYINKLERKCERLGLNEIVTFHDFVDHDNLSAFYNAADIGVFPGKLGITIAEAIATGLPVVVCEDPATDILLSNDNGLSFHRGDNEMLGKQISRYVCDDELRSEHSRRSVELCRSELSWESIAKNSIDIYESYE